VRAARSGVRWRCYFIAVVNTVNPQKWLDQVTEWAENYGSFPHGRKWGFDRHHVAGRKFKHDKVHIGERFVIPVQTELHQVNSDHPLNVTNFRHNFTEEFGSQRYMWADMVESMRQNFPSFTLPTDEEIACVMSTKY